MATDADKENITDGFLPSVTEKSFSMSPRRSKKSRSLSMGPASSSILKENAGNRRKSAFPSVKSILSGAKDTTAADVKKRKEARRKSLANRRVSFAPEATLHTWDVIEYMKDATTSSASSESERRASAASQELSFKSPEPESPEKNARAEPPSTPPKQADELVELGSSPANQRDIHQKKRRRNSPGVHLKSTGDVFSSSPLSGSSPVKDGGSGDSDSDEMGDATMDLDDPTAQSIGSGESLDSTSSSGRLDAALKQAAVHAGTQQLNANDDGDATMDLADDEVTNAFKPWVTKNRRDSLAVHRMVASEDQENIHPLNLTNAGGDNEDATQDISMDITRAIGGIVQEDSSNNTTKALRGLKRRRSSNLGSMTKSSGSPVQRPITRKSLSRRRSSTEESVLGDETMDLTMAVGSIQSKLDSKTNQQESSDTSTGDETMDFTVAIGSIKDSTLPTESTMNSLPNTELLEDMSMELTENLGMALSVPIVTTTPNPVKSKRSPRKSILPASVTVDRPHTPQKSPSGSKISSDSTTTRRAVQPSPHRSTRKSIRANKTVQEDQYNTQMASIIPVPATEAIPDTPMETTAQVLTPSQKTFSQPIPRIEVKSATKTTSISDTLKLLSTPRKEILPSPAFFPPSDAPRIIDSPKKLATPKKVFPPKLALTPQRSSSPRKRVRIDVSKSPEKSTEQAEGFLASEIPDDERISLQDFLSMTNIRFLDLTTTKRRATGHPGAEGMLKVGLEDNDNDQEPNLENNVAAAVAIIPMLSMYQHSCHEMKSYISSGRTEVQNLEVDALEHQPPLFHEYGSASLAEKNIMDGQLRDLKTNARLQSKGGWHNWRSQLLSDLKTGLLQTSRDLDQDDRLISQIEATFQGILPELSLKERSLEEELRMLECRKQDAEENTGAEVEEARRQLQAIEADLKEKGALLTSLKSDLETQQSSVDDARSWKAETIAAIAEADRITEEHRGWSVSEVSSLQDKLSALEEKLGWSLVSASETSVTLAHNDLHLTFNPDSWMTQSHTPDPDAPDSQVLLTYVGRTQDEPSHPRATVHRFFLQLLRAHALSLPQNRTRASTLLAVVSAGWDLASRVDAALAALAVAGVTEACIEGDERVALRFVLLLPSLRTKVHVCFTIDVAIVGEAVDGRVRVSANVVYGEKYDEPKMADFLKKFVQGHVGSMDEIRQWADGVEDLRGRLLRRGRKD